MKQLGLIVMIAGALISCNRANPEHEFFVTGVLLENCDTKTPLGGAEIQFDVNGQTYASTKTNSFGEFTLSGTAVEKGGGHKNTPYLAINYTAEDDGGYHYKKLAILPFSGANLDTLYYHGTQLVQMKVEPEKSAFTEKDTLFIRYTVPYNVDPYSSISSFGDKYMLKYPGPFDGSLDTVLMAGHSHPKFHNDSPYLITYWVNSYQDWRDKAESYKVTYSEKGPVDQPLPGCNEITPAIISLK